jgi:PIN domain nuclease of toxin-antitoxin system
VRLLLDTHTLIWAVDDPTQLGPRAAAELRDLSNELLLGAGALWEMSIKVGLQKLDCRSISPTSRAVCTGRC